MAPARASFSACVRPRLPEMTTPSPYSSREHARQRARADVPGEMADERGRVEAQVAERGGNLAAGVVAHQQDGQRRAAVDDFERGRLAGGEQGFGAWVGRRAVGGHKAGLRGEAVIIPQGPDPVIQASNGAADRPFDHGSKESTDVGRAMK